MWSAYNKYIFLQNEFALSCFELLHELDHDAVAGALPATAPSWLLAHRAGATD